MIRKGRWHDQQHMEYAGEGGNGGGTLEQVEAGGALEQVEAGGATYSDGSAARSSTLRRRERWGLEAVRSRW
jgi:hypothetical protein